MRRDTSLRMWLALTSAPWVAQTLFVIAMGVLAVDVLAKMWKDNSVLRLRRFQWEAVPMG